jgi:hypothetical protein
LRRVRSRGGKMHCGRVSWRRSTFG